MTLLEKPQPQANQPKPINQQQQQQQQHQQNLTKINNILWYCPTCLVQCNSDSQFDVHMISQKHKFAVEEDETRKLKDNSSEKDTSPLFTQGSAEELKEDLVKKNINRNKPNFSMTEIAENPIAHKFNINAVKYLIPSEKKLGKFEKFGFYCQICDAYMTGQIQLVMHVRGAKHQFYFPNEIPNYKSTKTYQPNTKSIPLLPRKHRCTNFSETGFIRLQANQALPIRTSYPITTTSQAHYISDNIKPDFYRHSHPALNHHLQQQQQQQNQFNNFQDHHIPWNFNKQITHPLIQFSYQQMHRQLIVGQTKLNHLDDTLINDNQARYSNQFWNCPNQNLVHYNNNINNNNNNKQLPYQSSTPHINNFKFNQSPIAYMPTPPSSFNQTPIKLDDNQDNNLNSFNSFSTPGGYSYYHA